MKTNLELQADVQHAIKWEPLLHDTQIGVTAKDGIVSLSGTVTSYAKKIEVENVVKKVIGVKAIVEKIEVQLPEEWKKTDHEIAHEAVKALTANWLIPKEKITVKVENGWVTLDGELPWHYQKDAAKDIAYYLDGVKGITNNIKIKPETHDSIEKKDVERALSRSLSVDDSDIQVSVTGTHVTLTGTVNSWHQKEEAGHIAWKTPGIWHVENNISVDYYYELVG
jgi:osmotically-inducible protein OsmY